MGRNRGRSRSTSPEPSSTATSCDAPPSPPKKEKKASGRTKSPIGCCGKPKKKIPKDDDTVAETDASEVPPKSIACMRESLQSIIDNSCDGPCNQRTVEPPCPPFPEQVQCTCAEPKRSSPTETVQFGTSREPSRCICNPALCPVESVPAKAPMQCICDPALCPVAPTVAFEPCCDCNAPGQQVPGAQDCPCDCDPGPESTCYTKRSAFQRIKCMFGMGARPSSPPGYQANNKLYTFQQQQSGPLPRRLVFNLVDGSPAPVAKAPPPTKGCKPKTERIERIVATPAKKYRMKDENKVEIYYFDHGNTGFYRTTDNPPPLITDMFLEKGEKYATKFWANIFGVLNIGLAFFIIFFLQLIRFLAYGILRPLIVGLIQNLSDYFFKPFLSIVFNGIIQPICILLFNTATSISDICKPLATGIGYFLREMAHLCRAFRLVEVNNVHACSSGPAKTEKVCSNRRSTAGPCDVI